MAAGATAGLVVALLVGPWAGGAPGQAAPVIDDGRGLAGATVLAVAPATGALELAVTSGQSRAETSGGLAQALARSFSLGLIGSAISAEACDGGEPVVTAGQLPQALRADNRSGPQSFTSTELPLLAPVFGVGTEAASADLVPASHASVTTGDAEISELLTIAGGRSEASSVVFPGDGREASAGVSVDVELAGLVRLTGLRWSARHRTGATESADATFTIGGLEIAGAPIPLGVPLASLEPVGVLINAALAPLGLRVEMPTVERITDPVDLIRVTPLRLLVADTPLSAIVQPSLDLTRDFRSQVFDALVAADCSLGSTLLLGDVLTGVASGTGALVLTLGGAEAGSGDVVEEDLFGDLPAFTPAGPIGSVSSAAPRTPGGIAPSVARPSAAPAGVRGPSERTCESTHPTGASCSVGSATVAGVVGAAATAGVATLDLRRRRRLARTGTA